jgi:hypothetical protein
MAAADEVLRAAGLSTKEGVGADNHRAQQENTNPGAKGADHQERSPTMKFPVEPRPVDRFASIESR